MNCFGPSSNSVRRTSSAFIVGRFVADYASFAGRRDNESIADSRNCKGGSCGENLFPRLTDLPGETRSSVRGLIQVRRAVHSSSIHKDFVACCVADTPLLLRFVVNPFP